METLWSPGVEERATLFLILAETEEAPVFFNIMTAGQTRMRRFETQAQLAITVENLLSVTLLSPTFLPSPTLAQLP